MALPDGIALRRAASDDLVGVMRVLDGALLETDVDVVRDRIDAGDVHVAIADPDTDREHIVGATVVVPRETTLHLTAIAVRRNRRGRGIGSALVEHVVETGRDRDADRLTAAFDAELRAFYIDLDFEIERRNGRLWGERPAFDGTH